MESLVVSAAPPSNGVQTGGGGFPVLDSNALLRHIATILEVTLGASWKDLESAGSLLSPGRLADTTTRVTRFGTESQLALYIQKDILPSDGLDGIVDGPSMFSSRLGPFPS